MKNSLKKIYTVSLLILISLSINGVYAITPENGSALERIVIVTDRDSYMSGEAVWVSLFCFDLSGPVGSLSRTSSVAYIELQNEKGLPLTAKLHINEGRGSGKIDLPPSLPTGNYKLVAYTKQMLNEEHPEYFVKVLSIFNTLTTERVEGNVVVATGESTAQAPAYRESNNLHLSFETDNALNVNNSYPVSLKNSGKGRMTLSVAIVRKDNLPEHSSNIFRSILSADKWNKSVSLPGKFVPEYEGEIVEGVVNQEGGGSVEQYIAFFSAVGNFPDVYSTFIDKAGSAKFFTNSIFGDREAVLEVPTADTAKRIEFILNSPFVKPDLGEFPKLVLDKAWENSLNERSIEMQIGRRFNADTLFDNMKVRKDPLLHISPKVYKLDDYTRFPVMSEVMVEYIPELRFRKLDKVTDLQVRWSDSFNSITFSKGSTLALVDGIPVFSHQRIFDYDPLKIKSISIYPGEFFMGAANYDGLIMFRTYKGDYSGLKFNKNAKIVDYQGVQYPCRFTATKLISKDNTPDLRSLLYWDPQVEIEPGGETKFVFHTSALPGSYSVKISGVDSNGEYVSWSGTIEVK